MSDPIVKQITDKLYATEPDPEQRETLRITLDITVNWWRLVEQFGLEKTATLGAGADALAATAAQLLTAAYGVEVEVAQTEVLF